MEALTCRGARATTSFYTRSVHTSVARFPVDEHKSAEDDEAAAAMWLSLLKGEQAGKVLIGRRCRTPPV